MSIGEVNNELLVGFIDESTDSLTAVDSLFVKLEAAPADMDIVNALFRPIHSLKGNAAYFGLMKIKKLAHTMENLLDLVRKGLRPVNRSLIDTLLPGVDALRAMLAKVRDGAPESADDNAFTALLAKIEAVLATPNVVPVVTNTAPPQSEIKQESEAPKENAAPQGKHDKTMRIPEQSLDDFLRCVGELLGVEEMLRHLLRQSNSGAGADVLANSLKEAVRQFEGISKELRTKIMEVRKVEARVLLQKAPRIVRDIAAVSGKKIVVECIGEEAPIDKSYIDLLDAPLTHMVRNAADHGIETPAQRLSAGKIDTGRIVITIRENADNLQLIIKDDGAGLNHDGLLKKAIALGLVAPNAQLSQKDIVDLLFQSGVSTATTVTDVSGRGVGMDVVKRAVVDAGGKIDITSAAGSGTTFTVTLPRNASTQIFDGYMVRSFSNDLYVLPIGSVIEAFRIVPEELSSIVGKGQVVNRRHAVFPLHTLDTLLGLEKTRQNRNACSSEMGVLVELRGEKMIVAVKEIVGIQKVVCKPVEGGILDNELFDGAAISGTGHVSMIINMEKLLKRN
jgi:two-component system chemotaxis sensor kinase CheA